MSQNQKNKTPCHAELVSASKKEDIMLNGFRLGGRNDKRVQSGRSMVEMLGVLAIVGVLTIGGIAGYRYAINKSNANTILGAVSQMAVTASTELTTQGSLTLPEWKDASGNLSISGAYGVEMAQYDDGAFGIIVSNMNDEVCERIKGMDWKVPEDVAINGESDSCDQGEANTVEFVFSNTLGKNGNKEEDDTHIPLDCSTDSSVCSGCQICQGGTCTDSQEKCGNGICHNGSCTCSNGHEACGTLCCPDGKLCVATGYYGKGDYTCVTPSSSVCTKNSDCAENQFCDFATRVGWEGCHTPNSGVCKNNGNLSEVHYNGKTFYLSDTGISWWGAENLCLSFSKKLTSLGALGLSKKHSRWTECLKGTYYCYDDDWEESITESCDDCQECYQKDCTEYGERGDLYKAFNKIGFTGRFWTTDTRDPCAAYYVQIRDDYESVGTDHKDSGSRALCE